jgi:hypothetical protein
VIIEAPCDTPSNYMLPGTRVARGTCPASGDTLASQKTCQLSCVTDAGYTSGGLLTCVKGAWSGSEPNCAWKCPVNNLPAGLAMGNCPAVMLSGTTCLLTKDASYALVSSHLKRSTASTASAFAHMVDFHSFPLA